MMSNQTNRVIYTGVTNDLQRRIYEHKTDVDPNSFTSKYKVNKLVYFEQTDDVMTALEREKQIKAGSRAKKVTLIETNNKKWRDLSEDWFEIASWFDFAHHPELVEGLRSQ